jgi:hypothetical protein
VKKAASSRFRSPGATIECSYASSRVTHATPAQ